MTEKVCAETVEEFILYLEKVKTAVEAWDGTFRKTLNTKPMFQKEPVFADRFSKLIEGLGYAYAGWDDFWTPYFELDKEGMLEAVTDTLDSLRNNEVGTLESWGLLQ